MIEVKQIEELERSLRFTLQKAQYLKNALAHLAAKRATPGFGLDLDYPAKDAKRQERILFAVAGELRDEINKLPEPAAAEQKAGG